MVLGYLLFWCMLEGQTKYCQENVSTVKIGIGKAGGRKRIHLNASDWIRMEAICNYVVGQRREEICGQSGNAFENDYQGREEIDSSN
jgi:hypothetical protein